MSFKIHPTIEAKQEGSYAAIGDNVSGISECVAPHVLQSSTN